MSTPSALLAAAMAALAVLTSGCGAQRPPGAQADLIPAGRAHWVRVEREIRLDSLAGPRLVLPYGPPGAVPGAATPQAADAGAAVTGQSVVFKPDPLDRSDRCGLEVVALRLERADGGSQEIPASGYVIDNSDGLQGLRVEPSKLDRRNLVIPAGATATVVFTSAVPLHPPAAAEPGK
jgi:hypothetical protein